VFIEISQGIKTFWVYLKALLEKLFQTFYYFLKNLYLFKAYASPFAKEILTKCSILNKVCITNNVFENEFQNIIKYFP
jgi:hypothetical protein